MIWFILYLIGVVISYILMRNEIKKESKYTLRDRFLSVSFSFLGSWGLVSAILIIKLWNMIKINWDKEVKW